MCNGLKKYPISSKKFMQIYDYFVFITKQNLL